MKNEFKGRFLVDGERVLGRLTGMRSQPLAVKRATRGSAARGRWAGLAQNKLRDFIQTRCETPFRKLAWQAPLAWREAEVVLALEAVVGNLPKRQQNA
jgi:hypothetical protein